MQFHHVSPAAQAFDRFAHIAGDPVTCYALAVGSLVAICYAYAFASGRL